MIEVLLFLAPIAFIVFLLIWTKRPMPDPPPGVKITHSPHFGYSYWSEDRRLMGAPIATGYLTQRAAIRAARAEYERVEGRNE